MKRRPYEKFLDKGLRGWIVRTAQRHYWRVAAWHDLDDVVAEGYLAFAICKARYEKRVENKAHFMALFKRVYISRITDLANKRSRDIPEIAISQIAQEGRELSALEFLGGGISGDAEMMCLLNRAPAEIANLIESMNAGYLRGRRNRKKRNGTRETNNEFFNRMLGTDGIDYEQELRSLLT